MKKIISLVSAVVIIAVMFCSCSKVIKDDKIYQLGEKVSTDIAEFTLEYGAFAIALENTVSEDYLMPKEYDAADDAKNPYIASKGHTLAAITFSLNNLDRTSLDLSNFIKCEYKNEKGKKETASLEFGGKSKDSWGWESYTSSNILLSAGDTGITYRAYVEIDTEIKDLKSDFNVIVKLPNSDGSEYKFVYSVTEDGRKAYSGKGITYEKALSGFTNESAREYFTQNQKDFEKVKGSKIADIVTSKRWNVVYVYLSNGKSVGHWTGHFNFLSNGKIKDDYGFVNERTWKVSGDMLVLDNKYECTMRYLKDRDGYLLVCDGEAYGLLKK